LDQPAGVGFSYGQETDTNEQMISEDAYYFLQAFFQKFPEYSTNPLYIVGESYGGHYAPAIAHRVWRGNQKKAQGTIQLNLSGIAIGNGLTDPEEQYKWYAEMAFNNSHHIKAVDQATYDSMTQVIPKCTALIHECNKGNTMVETFACQTAFVVCNIGLTSPYQMTGLNPYDIRKECGASPLCYDFSNIETFLNLPETRKALHVTDESPAWNACNMGINLKFHTDWMKDFSPYIADLLNDGLKVLIYAGDVDFICNYLGNRAWTLGLEWDHSKEFVGADDHDWNSGKGLARTANGFTFLQVYDAGHMVPSDQPEVALDMIKIFVNGGDF
jgi:cathepsin A (carboxypeptidase C)